MSRLARDLAIPVLGCLLAVWAASAGEPGSMVRARYADVMAEPSNFVGRTVFVRFPTRVVASMLPDGRWLITDAASRYAADFEEGVVPGQMNFVASQELGAQLLESVDTQRPFHLSCTVDVHRVQVGTSPLIVGYIDEMSVREPSGRRVLLTDTSPLGRDARHEIAWVEARPKEDSLRRSRARPNGAGRGASRPSSAGGPALTNVRILSLVDLRDGLIGRPMKEAKPLLGQPSRTDIFRYLCTRALTPQLEYTDVCLGGVYAWQDMYTDPVTGDPVDLRIIHEEFTITGIDIR